MLGQGRYVARVMSHHSTQLRSWHSHTLGFSMLLSASFASPAFGDNVTEPLRPPRIDEAPRIDGRLDEALW
jgi:hypothetical protein